MIKMQTHRNLLFEKPKMVRQPVSLKKNLIAFLGQNSQSPKLSTSSFVNRAIKSPSKQTSQRFKVKSQRQKQIFNYEAFIQNQSPLFNQQLTHNPQNLMQRSNSHKIQTSKAFRNTASSINSNVKRSKEIKSARTSEDQIGVKNFRQSQQFQSKRLSSSQISNKINLIQKRKFDLNNFMISPNKNDLIVCKSLTKRSQFDCFDNQISKLISKKVGEKQVQDNDLSDETSFNVVLQKIKEKNKSEVSETDFETKKQRYLDKLKNSAFMFQTPQRKYVVDQCRTSQDESNIFRSSQFSKKGNFKAALQWSSKRLQIMKSPFIKNMKSKKEFFDKGKAKKEDDQIQGWFK